MNCITSLRHSAIFKLIFCIDYSLRQIILVKGNVLLQEGYGFVLGALAILLHRVLLNNKRFCVFLASADPDRARVLQFAATQWASVES